MFDFVVDIINWFNQLSKDNPIVAGAISLWGLGTLSYLGRNIPQLLWTFLKRQLTITLTIKNYDTVFYNFLLWFQNSNHINKVRTVAVNTGRYGDGEPIYSAGFGTHYFWFGHKFFQILREEKEETLSLQSKETITIRTLGRNKKVFLNLLHDIAPEKDKRVITRVFKWSGNYWKHVLDQPERSFESVVLPNNNLQQLINHIDDFLTNREWYLDNGIPYRTGILFEGHSGTGKTSLVRALCGKYNKKLFIISIREVTDDQFENAMLELPSDSVVLIEDIDEFDKSTGMVIKRTSKIKPKEPKEESSNEGLTVSGLLNGIDGVISSDGRILIATTNHFEMLEPRLIREGRFDLTVNFDYLNKECFIKFIKRFYPQYVFNSNGNLKIKSKVAPAKLQKLIIDNKRNLQPIFDEIVVEGN